MRFLDGVEGGEGGDILIFYNHGQNNPHLTASWSGKRDRTEKHVVPSEDDMDRNGC